MHILSNTSARSIKTSKHKQLHILHEKTCNIAILSLIFLEKKNENRIQTKIHFYTLNQYFHFYTYNNRNKDLLKSQDLLNLKAKNLLTDFFFQNCKVKTIHPSSFSVKRTVCQSYLFFIITLLVSSKMKFQVRLDYNL